MPLTRPPRPIPDPGMGYRMPSSPDPTAPPDPSHGRGSTCEIPSASPEATGRVSVKDSVKVQPMSPLTALCRRCHLTALPPNAPNPEKASTLLKTKELPYQGDANLFKGDTWS